MQSRKSRFVLFLIAGILSGIPAAGLFDRPSLLAADASSATKESTQDDQSHATYSREKLDEFLAWNCYDCHTGESAEAGLDLTSLSRDLDDEHVFAQWVHVFDRVDAGEMPPEDYGELEDETRMPFLSMTQHWLQQHQQKQFREHGRIQGRRLTSKQLERTLHDLLGIDIPLDRHLPTETDRTGFSTYVENQSTSHFHLQRHLAGVDVALDEAFSRAFRDDDYPAQKLTAKELARTRRRTREPELIDGQIVIWSSRLAFYGRVPATTAKEDGWYRFTLHGVQSLKPPQGKNVWCSVRRGRCVSSAPLLPWVGSFEATDEPDEVTFETWLPKGHMLEIRPGDATLKMARFRGGQAENGEGGKQDVPGLAIDAITMERFHRGPDAEQIRQYLFDDLELTGIGQVKSKKQQTPSLKSDNPKSDAARLMTKFASRAFRRPVDSTQIQSYIDLVQHQLQEGSSLLDSLRTGYRALLCSPNFTYLTEHPGALDDYALASRLSYFLVGTMPDSELMELAQQGKLSDRKVLKAQANRLLNSERGKRFVRDFAAEWLDMDQIDFTNPDRRLAPGFDPIVQHSMLAETETYLQRMLEKDISVEQLIDSDYTFLNSRLADYYNIDNVAGDTLQQVSLPPKSPRGGLLTQGAIMKVTANGTTTSPVIRGIWVSERLLGIEIPPPPENVPAIEPDIRGATSIRDMLAKHRADASCASCHNKVDPAGFALENFDAAGQWRERYGQKSKGVKIDPSYQLPDGREFADVTEFKDLVAAHPEQLAANVVRQMIGFGTGREVSFADRPQVQNIVQATADDDYGFRSLLLNVITSPVFTHK